MGQSVSERPTCLSERIVQFRNILLWDFHQKIPLKKAILAEKRNNKKKYSIRNLLLFFFNYGLFKNFFIWTNYQFHKDKNYDLLFQLEFTFCKNQEWKKTWSKNMRLNVIFEYSDPALACVHKIGP